MLVITSSSISLFPTQFTGQSLPYSSYRKLNSTGSLNESKAYNANLPIFPTETAASLPHPPVPSPPSSPQQSYIRRDSISTTRDLFSLISRLVDFRTFRPIPTSLPTPDPPPSPGPRPGPAPAPRPNVPTPPPSPHKNQKKSTGSSTSINTDNVDDDMGLQAGLSKKTPPTQPVALSSFAEPGRLHKSSAGAGPFSPKRCLVQSVDNYTIRPKVVVVQRATNPIL